MAVQWPAYVNNKVRRVGTSWEEIKGFISDPTLSGKQKRRMAHSMAKRTFQVSFLFSYYEYLLFSNWYQNDIKYGTLSFEFPKIDGIGNAEYMIASDGAPKYSNQSGRIIKCNMIWEEV